MPPIKREGWARLTLREPIAIHEAMRVYAWEHRMSVNQAYVLAAELFLKASERAEARSPARRDERRVI